jgi:hypothetical protein
VSRLKQHLSRCHYTSKYRCKTCLETFPQEVDLREHLDASLKCTYHPDSFGPSGKGFSYTISKVEWDAITRVVRRPRFVSAEERWANIWGVLFPHSPEQPSPYAETGFPSGDLFLFCQHLTTTGSQALSSFLQHTESLEVDPAVISEFLESFCRNWAQRQGSTTSSTNKVEPGIQKPSVPSAAPVAESRRSPLQLDSVRKNPFKPGCWLSEPSSSTLESSSLDPSTFGDGSVTGHSWSTSTTLQSSYIPSYPETDRAIYWGDFNVQTFSGDEQISFWNAPILGESEANNKLGDSGEQITRNAARPIAGSDAKSPPVTSESTARKPGSSSAVSDNESPETKRLDNESPETERSDNESSETERSDNENSSVTNEGGSQTSSEGTTSSDTLEFGDILVPDGSRFSSALSAAVRALTVAYKTESQTMCPLGMACAACNPTDALESASPQNTPSDSAGSLTSLGIHSLQTELTSQASSQRGHVRHKRGREEDDEPKKPSPPKRKRIENGAKRLACPFQKKYPLKHFFCGAKGAKGDTRGFVHISHIKDHINRCHIRSLLYCPVCKEDFENPESFAQHVREQSCEEQPFRDETALPRTAALSASLRARVDKALSLPEQWLCVWRILFAGEDEPRSCLVDDVPEHTLQYQQFITRRGGDIVCLMMPELRFLDVAADIFDRSETSSVCMACCQTETRSPTKIQNSQTGMRRRWWRLLSVPLAWLLKLSSRTGWQMSIRYTEPLHLENRQARSPMIHPKTKKRPQRVKVPPQTIQVRPVMKHRS